MSKLEGIMQRLVDYDCSSDEEKEDEAEDENREENCQSFRKKLKVCIMGRMFF